ncbi:MAG: hypothetical protein Q8N60_00915, partial [Candidatus Diapherotrites archaeon]|nr:hypothetical protein [Candidatus Diapherotrites archaeon]
VLKVDAERVDYQTEYDTKENEHPSIKVKERKENKERFRLQFNSFNPLLVEPEMRPIPNCKLGTVVGVTGPSAVPKVSFNWDWGSIAEDACVEGNPNYVYCDATQFSIVVLKKLQRLQQFIEEQKPFDCPTAATAGAVKEQPLLGTAYDVAITKVQANKSGAEDANIIVSIESNNDVKMDAELTIDLRNAATGELAKRCTRILSVLSKTIENCEFKDLSEGLYNVRASVSATLCPTCENSSPENDSIEAVLAIGSAGVAECDPFNTKRLPLFIEATEASAHAGWNAQQREQILKTIKFNAFLMQDAFTDDFRKDFDMFCKQQSFFDCPEYYLDASTGLQRFFADQERFKFDYSMAPHAPADAGKYTVTINIEFDNKNWDLFSANEPSAKISIEMVKLSTPEPDSPFYYMPFDGLIGIDSEDGRQGYGINFRQTSEETIKVNNSREQPIVSSNIANSTPVLDGWIEAGRNDSFRRMNLDARGILLDVRAAADSTRVTLSPSYATPVIMQVTYEKGEHAYGFYSIEVDTAEQVIGEETIGGSPQAAFSKMIAWSGIGPVCRDFGDRPVMEAWQDTWDEHGGITGNQQCAIGTDITDFGIEWCNPIRKGSVFLEGVIFTPQNSTSLMKRATYSDDMQLISVGNKGSQIALNGIAGMSHNSFPSNNIDSLEDVFELVRDNKVCLIGQGNRIRAQFFWNPKAVLEVLAAERDKAAEKCIKITQ